MEVFVHRTQNTPDVEVNNGQISISGKSIPTGNLGFCKTFYKLIKDYSQAPENETIINVKLDCINGSSTRCLMQSFKVLEHSLNGKKRVLVNWFYNKDDEDMHELGTIYQSLLAFPFKFVKY
jgi:hypothetical protein